MDQGVVILLLLFALTIVTVVGHGIWVLLAKIVRLLGGTSGSPAADRDSQRPPRGACPRCLTALAPEVQLCGVCGWPHAESSPAHSQAALSSLRSQLDRFVRLGLVDQATHAQLVHIVDSQALGMRTPKPAATAAPVDLPVAPLASSVTPPLVEPATEAAIDPSVVLVPIDEPAAPVAPTPQPRITRPTVERAKQFAASRAAAAAEPPPPPPPPPPREALSRLLASFMEEKNIRWGELVGGLLIVGCSVALVISFWAQIAAGPPFLKFVLFNGVTAALFGVGLYTDKKWKLHMTSRGVLIIATLLVPLNFLAIAAFTQDYPPTDALSLSGEAMSIALFSVLVYLSAKIIYPDGPVLVAIGVMLPSLVQLLVRRWAGPASAWTTLYALAAPPIACYVASTWIAVRRYWSGGAESNALDEPAANRLFTFIGILSAATLLPLALLVSKLPPILAALHRLSPLAVWCGVPALVVGLLFWRRIGDRRHVGQQTAGISIGVLGALVMVAAAVAAWPEPVMLLPVALMNVAVFTVIALGFGIPAALVPAGLALVAAWLIAFHLQRGNVSWQLDSYEPMSRALLSIASGHALAPLVGLFALAAWQLGRRKRAEDSTMVAVVAGVTLVLSLFLVVWFGFGRSGDPGGATWTLGLYAVIALAGAAALDLASLAWCGWGLLLAALVQAIVFRSLPTAGVERPWIAALLAHATIALCVWAAFARGTRRNMSWVAAAAQAVAPSSAVAAVLIVLAMFGAPGGTLAIYCGWLAAIWLVASALLGDRRVLAASQVAAAVAVFWAVVASVEGREWYAAAARPWHDPWFLEAVGVALALYCVVCEVGRFLIVRVAKPQAAEERVHAKIGWVPVSWPGFDRVLEIALVVLVLLVSCYGAAPGVAQELAPLENARGNAQAVREVPPIAAFKIAGTPHAHAADRGAWMLAAAVVAALVAGFLTRSAVETRLVGLLLVLAAACPLLAARWEAEVAVASALRWIGAAFFLAASVPVWLRWRVLGSGPPAFRQIRDLLVAIVVLTYVAMGVYVVQAALGRSGAPVSANWLWPYLLVWAVFGMAAALLLPRATKLALGAMSPAKTDQTPTWADTTSVVLAFMAIAPVAILFAFVVAKALDQHPLVGPELTSWLRRIGTDVTYGVPLAAIAVGLVGYAVRDRSSGFAFSAGLLGNIVATMVVLIRLVKGGGALDAWAWILVAQVNAIVSGVVGLVWMGGMKSWPWRGRSDVEPPALSTSSGQAEPGAVGADGQRAVATGWPALVYAQGALAAALCGIFLAPAVVKLAVEPKAFAWAAAGDGVLGWTACILAAACVTWLFGIRSVSQRSIVGFAAAVVALLALTATRSDTGNWLAYYWLLAGCCAAQWLVPVAPGILAKFVTGEAEQQSAMSWSTVWARSFGVATVILALRALDPNPLFPWGAIGALVVTGSRNIWIAWHEGRRGSVWFAAILFNLAASIWWLDTGWRLTGATGFLLFDFVWFNIIVTAATTIVSAALVARGPEKSATSGRRRLAGFHRFAAWAAVFVMFCTTAIGLAADLAGNPVDASSLLEWLAWLATLAMAVACLWDASTRWPVACLYCVGLVGVGIYLDGLDFRAPMFPWALANALAAYSVVTAYLWSMRQAIREQLVKWRVPIAAADNTWRPEGSDSSLASGGHGWLAAAGGILAAVVVYLVGWVEIFMPTFSMRMIAAYAVGAEALAMALLAQGAVRSPLQYTSLALGALFAVAFGCAWIDPQIDAPWLHRAVAAAASQAAATVVFGIGLVKLLRRENEWTRAAGRLVPVLIVGAATLLVVVLFNEVTAFAAGRAVALAWPAKVAVLAALVGLAIAALIAALVPGRDPLGLSERGRTMYVYAAEALAALAFIHIRVTMPELFRGWFRPYWPLVVMAVAFVGVGLGELFQRLRQRVLSEPLTNTGALLPLLPALGFWIMSSEVHVHYSLLLLSVGALYAGLSVLRKSFLFAVLSAVAANGSLWYLLYQREKLGIAEHPQLWLIPPALCVLAAGYLNRARLSAEQLAALRYGCAIVIYASSTADIFINGVAKAPWLPAVLAGFSIAGVFAGILLRVRAFLYLGTAFLMVAILTVIWHAGRDGRTYVYWIAGIVTGVLILALFGLFEKRRDDLLRLVDRLKQWEA